jgi:hypothetical protein
LVGALKFVLATCLELPGWGTWSSHVDAPYASRCPLLPGRAAIASACGLAPLLRARHARAVGPTRVAPLLSVASCQGRAVHPSSPPHYGLLPLSPTHADVPTYLCIFRPRLAEPRRAAAICPLATIGAAPSSSLSVPLALSLSLSSPLSIGAPQFPLPSSATR